MSIGTHFSGVGRSALLAMLLLALMAPSSLHAATTTGGTGSASGGTGGAYSNFSGYDNFGGYQGGEGQKGKNGTLGPKDVNNAANGNGQQTNSNTGSANNLPANANTLPSNATSGATPGSSSTPGASAAPAASGSIGSSGVSNSSAGGAPTGGSASPVSPGGGSSTGSSGGATNSGSGSGGGTGGGGYNNTGGYKGPAGDGSTPVSPGYPAQVDTPAEAAPAQEPYPGDAGTDVGGATATFVQAKSAGQVFCNAFYNTGNLPNLISLIAYVAGMAVFIRGAFDIIKRSSDPNKPLRDGLLGLMVGAFIVSLPFLVEFLHNSIFGLHSSTYQMPKCDANAGVGASTTSVQPLDVMLMNFVNNIKDPIISFISLMCMVLGAAMILWNMLRLSKFGADAKSNALTPILSNLVIGAMLMAVGQTLNVSLTTLFGDGAVQGHLAKYTELAYVPGGTFDMTRFNNAIKAVFDFLYIIGALSFVRGFMILRNAVDGQGQATKGQAFTHMIGGTLLVNMPGFIHIIENTMGFSIIHTSGG